MQPLLTFGAALEALKQGKRVARIGWNGKGMFLFLLPASDGIPTKVIHDPALRSVIESEVGGETFDAYGSIRMFTADKKILTGWLASQTDLLSEDWIILDQVEVKDDDLNEPLGERPESCNMDEGCTSCQ